MAKVGFARLRELSEDRLQFVRDWLLSGKEIMSLVRYVQKEWGVFGDLAEKTLGAQLTRYRRVVLLESGTARTKPDGTLVVKATARRDIDVEERLCALIVLQEERLQGFMETENKLKTPMQGVHQVITDIKELLVTLQKHRFDTGKDEYYGPVVGQKMGVRMTTPDGTVLEAVSAPVEDATKRALEVLNGYSIIGEGDGEDAGASSDR